ncbi:hypothetical protein ACWGK1_30015, partial [Streptomyces wedmorensis]
MVTLGWAAASSVSACDLLAAVDALAGLGDIAGGLHALGVHHGRGRFHRSGVRPAGPVPQQIVDLLGGSVRFPLGVVV